MEAKKVVVPTSDRKVEQEIPVRADQSRSDSTAYLVTLWHSGGLLRAMFCQKPCAKRNRSKLMVYHAERRRLPGRRHRPKWLSSWIQAGFSGSQRADDLQRREGFFRESGFTKGEVIAFYSAIAGTILPHPRDRPLTLKRYPDGITGEHFQEKNAPAYTPPWVKRFAVSRSEGAWTGVTLPRCLRLDHR
jgi:hypothetical protein